MLAAEGKSPRASLLSDREFTSGTPFILQCGDSFIFSDSRVAKEIQVLSRGCRSRLDIQPGS